jgi:arylsulfatase A-like enzyme
MTMDLFPTALDAATVACPHPIDGASFLPTVLGDTQPPLREDWFFSRREGGNAYGGKTIDALIRGDWKLLQNSPFAPLELYNLRDDPREEDDVARENPQIFNQLSAALRRQIQRAGAVPWQPPPRSEED